MTWSQENALIAPDRGRCQHFSESSEACGYAVPCVAPPGLESFFFLPTAYAVG